MCGVADPRLQTHDENQGFYQGVFIIVGNRARKQHQSNSNGYTYQQLNKKYRIDIFRSIFIFGLAFFVVVIIDRISQTKQRKRSRNGDNRIDG